jgi:hypothetical protein
MLAVTSAVGVFDPFYRGALSPLPQQTIRRFGATSSYEAGMIRLLMGCADICDASGVSIFTQRKNFLVLGFPQVRVKTDTGVGMTLSRLGLSWQGVDRHLRRSLIHQAYYKEVLAELVQFFLRSDQGEHTVAFLHAYRILERISFVFPLLFAVRAANYTSAFTSLKEYFKGGIDSELKLMRKFQDSSIDASTKDAPCVLDFGGLDASITRSCFDVARRCVSDGDVVSDVAPVLEIKSQALLTLLINLRNRYFHYSVNESANISVSEIGDSDDFFEIVNSSLLNWLSVLYLAVLTERIK